MLSIIGAASLLAFSINAITRLVVGCWPSDSIVACRSACTIWRFHGRLRASGCGRADVRADGTRRPRWGMILAPIQHAAVELTSPGRQGTTTQSVTTWRMREYSVMISCGVLLLSDSPCH